MSLGTGDQRSGALPFPEHSPRGSLRSPKAPCSPCAHCGGAPCPSEPLRLSVLPPAPGMVCDGKSKALRLAGGTPRVAARPGWGQRPLGRWDRDSRGLGAGEGVRGGISAWPGGWRRCAGAQPAAQGARPCPAQPAAQDGPAQPIPSHPVPPVPTHQFEVAGSPVAVQHGALGPAAVEAQRPRVGGQGGAVLPGLEQRVALLPQPPRRHLHGSAWHQGTGPRPAPLPRHGPAPAPSCPEHSPSPIPAPIPVPAPAPAAIFGGRPAAARPLAARRARGRRCRGRGNERRGEETASGGTRVGG